MANTPFECLLAGADISRSALCRPRPAPPALPEHDVLLVAACALDANAGALGRAAELIAASARPVLNRPEHIALTTREAAYALLGKLPGIAMAHTVRVGRERLPAAAGASGTCRRKSTGSIRSSCVRSAPTPARASRGWRTRRNCASTEGAEADTFYVAPFIDYSGADGLFRKYRIVLIDGVPYVCHMGISRHWMVHYPYEEMIAHPGAGKKRPASWPTSIPASPPGIATRCKASRRSRASTISASIARRRPMAAC